MSPEDVTGRPAGSERVTAIASPGHGSTSSYGASAPMASNRAAPATRAPGVADPFRPIAELRPGPASIAPQMDRLDRGDDAELCEPTDIRWVNELQVLDPVRHRRPAARPAPEHPVPPERSRRRSRGSRSRSPLPRPGSPAPPSLGALVVGRPRGPPGGAPRSAVGLPWLEEERGPGEERSVPEDLQPAEPRSFGLAEWRAASEAALDR